MAQPQIIQGGMGIGVSNWRLARAVSKLGQLGVVSGTVLDSVVARRLQLGDPGGELRRAFSHFPSPEIAQRVLERYFIPGGKADDTPFRLAPLPTATLTRASQELMMIANFAEVFLAKETHQGLVGINFLEKIQLPMLPSLYGAMLASVDYVLMGAGIPREIPGVLDRLAHHLDVSIRLHVEGISAEDEFQSTFRPRRIIPMELPSLRRPKFLPIIASSTLAVALVKKSTGRIDGFVIEGPTAGGHNAPPRGALQLNKDGEPIYGQKDEVDLSVIRQLGLPFWLAGSYGSPQRLREAWQAGAAGVQVGTLFAFCRESGMTSEIKTHLLERIRHGNGTVFTDPVVSPAGFPFKVVGMEGSLSEASVYAGRPRLCDLGYLRHPYKKSDGTLGYRCTAEPVEVYVSKGGAREDTCGRKCLCNGLMATIGLAQRRRDGYIEPPLITAGDEFLQLGKLLRDGSITYSAADVVSYLLHDALGRSAT